MRSKGSFKSFGKRLERVVDNAVKNANHEMAEKAKSLCPTESGTLRDAIEEEKAGNCRYRTVVDVPYAMAVEGGTEDTPAIPFLRPAFDALEEDSIRRIANAVRKA